ncbi:mitogen-activated protein kinase 4-like [Mizuhopecten yessoensis]|uniref:Mitogen-activated protein kinase 6 n=1 Tax=Mizuhopecten yessoensis TaxID=6573 RepID=A0A210QH29_MIZYE|nr:mitogen-activated protein kinase 4-like [Mizuhopecten yessoensis]OWF47931.1 Mitogen-activated protein kinase 6 [Mizuhopecten yessoensis]
MADKYPSQQTLEDVEFCVDPRFTDLQRIGCGGNGIIYSAIDSDCDKSVAIKKLCFIDKKSCRYVLREIRIMRRLQHENIVTVYEVLGPNGFALGRHGNINVNEMRNIYIIQELLDIDLYQLVQQGQLTEEHTRLFLYQLLRGLKYIHSANVVHRDLKPANLLINLDDMVLKIADFGLARVVDTEYSHKGFLTDGVGTCWYRSPELIVSPRDYTKAIDIWGVGCIFAEMLTCKPLFPGANEMDQMGQIIDALSLNDNEWNVLTQVLPGSVLRQRSKAPKHSLRSKLKDFSSDAVDLLEKLLVFSPGQRLTAEEALAHPYLQKYSCPEDEPIVIKSFHIEHEIDDLSPKVLRKMINQESVEKSNKCGSHIEVTRVTDIKDSLVKKQDSCNKLESLKKSVSSSSTSSSSSSNSLMKNSGTSNDNQEIISDSLSSSTDSLTEIEIVPSDEICEEIIRIEENFQKEMQLNVVVNLPDEENKKEQLSPKEEKSQEEKESEKKGDKNTLEEKGLSSPRSQGHKGLKNFTCPKVKDRLNEEKRAESPRDEKPNKLKGKNDLEGVIIKGRSKDKSKGDNSKQEKMKNNKNNKYSVETNPDFDSMYRLPTEHLTQRRNSRQDCRIPIPPSTKVEDQLKLHEKLNEKLRLAELERDVCRCSGASGGNMISPGSEFRDEIFEDHIRSRTGSGSSGSNPSREDSPSCELPHRRFEH